MRKEYPRVENVLRLIAVGSAMSLFVLNPHLLIAFAYILKSINSNWEKYPRFQVKRTLDRLRKIRLIRMSEINGNVEVVLTDLGNKELIRMDIKNIEIKKPEKWDGKWWMVIFDIPDKYRKNRNIFQMTLKSLGFYFIQESVCVYPYKCNNEIELLRDYYQIKKYVDLIRVENFENEYKTRRIFNL